MFYAASEILFWLLLAAIVGGGIGYGMAQAKLVRLNKRLTQSRADAPMERELAIAWDTIEDLNRRLQVAHETIRDSNNQIVEIASADDDDELTDEIADDGTAIESDTPQALAALEVDDDDTVIDMAASRGAAAEASRSGPPDVAPPPAPDALKSAGPQVAAKAPAVAPTTQRPPEPPSDETVGTRLSERVASASIANQVDFTDGA